MRLDVGLVLVLRAEGMLEDVRRLAKALFNIAVFPGVVCHHVVMFLWTGHATCIAHEIGVQYWRVRAHGLEWIEHRGEFLALYLDALDRLLRGVDILSSHGCHLLPCKAHDITRQHGHITQEAPHQHLRDIEASQNGVHTWHSTCCRSVNREDAGIGIGTAQAFAHQRPRQVNISGVHCRSSDFLWSFGTSNRLADSSVWRGHVFSSCKCSYVWPLSLFQRGRKQKTLCCICKSV